MHPTTRHLAALSALALCGAAQATPIALYDGDAGNRPQDQAWMTYIAPLGPTATVVSGGVAVDTRGDANQAAGFFNHNCVFFCLGGFSMKNPAFPALDPTAGFRLSFELELIDEDHLSTDRSGFSVLLLGSNHVGIEIGIWENQAWAQSGPSFTHAEGSTGFVATGGGILYELTIQGTGYLLSANGTDILTGATRDYSPSSPFPDPYGYPNMLFLGDDTGSASASFILGDVLLDLGPFAVPTPGTWALLGLGLALGHRRRPV